MATGIFWASAVMGFFLTAHNPVLESFFVSPPMRAAIQAKRLWTNSLTRMAPAASSQIATNNISVSLLTWGLGLTFGIGTVWLLVFNGLMLGAIAAVCLRAGMFLPLAEFVDRPRIAGASGHLDQRRRRAAHGRGHALSRPLQPERRAAA